MERYLFLFHHENKKMQPIVHILNITHHASQSVLQPCFFPPKNAQTDLTNNIQNMFTSSSFYKICLLRTGFLYKNIPHDIFIYSRVKIRILLTHEKIFLEQCYVKSTIGLVKSDNCGINKCSNTVKP